MGAGTLIVPGKILDSIKISVKECLILLWMNYLCVMLM